MAVDVMNELEYRRKFLERRAALPAEALTRYASRWIAWSPDARIVADSEAPERCVVEGIPATDAMRLG
jgi:hypothetical protein